MPLAPGRRDRPLVNLALLALTLVSTWAVFRPSAGLRGSLAFSVSLLLILGCHEMGHYVLARRHGVDTSLPYFIPIPFGFGTLGAVIRIRSRIPTRNALVDIGAAGPLAGMAVAIPVLILGLARSHVATVPTPPFALGQEGSLLYVLRHLHPWSQTGTQMLSQELYGDNLLMLGLQRLVVGPLGPDQQVIAGPLVTAGWFGMLVTMLNLLPIGQLDGGHVSFALLGERARGVGRAFGVLLALLALFVTWSWTLWFVLTVWVIGVRHPPVELPADPLTGGRKLVALLCLVLLVLCFMPLPLRVV